MRLVADDVELEVFTIQASLLFWPNSIAVCIDGTLSALYLSRMNFLFMLLTGLRRDEVKLLHII